VKLHIIIIVIFTFNLCWKLRLEVRIEGFMFSQAMYRKVGKRVMCNAVHLGQTEGMILIKIRIYTPTLSQTNNWSVTG